MTGRLLIPLALLVGLPLAALVVAGLRLIEQERTLVAAREQELSAARLADTRATVARFVAEQERRLLALLDRAAGEEPRALARTTPLIELVFALDPAGELAVPSPGGPLSTQERAFVQRTAQLWLGHDHLARPGEAGSAGHGWYTWYWENDLGLIFWLRAPDGGVRGAEINRARLLAELIAELPRGNTPDDGAVQLRDARGQPLYQWGGYEVQPTDAPRAELALAAPLGAWRLAVFAADRPPVVGRGVGLALAGAFAALLVALAGLTVYLVRESRRELRDAASRVSFVNQVSHELKTPLTNIRMYAELLDGQLADADEKARRHLGVIIGESQRLSRLIANVLTFARHERRELALRPAPAVLDEVVDGLLGQFAPVFARRGLAVVRDGAAAEPRLLDTDAVAQVLANLLGNVEKYAAAGGEVRVTTGASGAFAHVVVHDNGPGIPAGERERIFAPYVRLSNAVSEGVSGTGIGLALARELARLHGGDLTVEPSARGARFLFTLRAEVTR